MSRPLALLQVRCGLPTIGRFAGWELDFSIREVFSPSGEEVPLTTGEFDLLVAFVNNPNQEVTGDRLIDLAHKREAEQLGRTIDVQVSRLRRKIEDDSQRPAMIKTVRGRGYKFTVLSSGSSEGAPPMAAAGGA